MQTEPTSQPGGGAAKLSRAWPRGKDRGGARAVVACAAVIAGVVVPGPTGPDAAETAIACGGQYTVARGDTLFSIAALAYGNGEHFRVLFDVNQDILSSSDSIDVGNVLVVPCLDGNEVGSKPLVMPVARSVTLQAPGEDHAALATQPARAIVPAVANAPGTAAPIEVSLGGNSPALHSPASGSLAPDSQAFAASVTVSTNREIVLLAGSLAPFADESLPQGGLLTELIARALQVVVPDWRYRIGFTGNWSSYTPSRANGETFDIGFPAIRPDCGPGAFKSELTQQACDSYVYSRPILMAEIAYYGRSGDPVVAETSTLALAGHRLCSADQPLEATWNPANPSALYSPEEPVPALDRCLGHLADGQTDVVMGLKSDADAAISRLGLGNSVSEIDGLRSTRTLHAFALKDDAYAREVLKALDRGIGDLMISGRWFEIVASHETDRFAFLTK